MADPIPFVDFKYIISTCQGKMSGEIVSVLAAAAAILKLPPPNLLFKLILKVRRKTKY